MKPFKFELLNLDGSARRGRLHTAHGVVETPAFMPVGTQATVKGMYFDQVKDLGAQVVLGNTYHLMLRPGAERIDALGGLHNFMNWSDTILTDSGGFQVMSLAQLRKITEEGVTFKSHIDGKRYNLTPERSIEIQGLLNSDIQMQLDECVALPADVKTIEKSMQMSLRWAERSRVAFEEMGGVEKGQALHGIVQGGDNLDLREASVRGLMDIPFEGYSIGGLAVGEPQEVMLRVLDHVCPILPQNKQRYLMGVGTPDDLVKSVARGIDMFDCVMPTRSGRHGLAFTRRGKVNLRNARHADDPRPLDEESSCPAARDYSRAYLHHLIRSKEFLGGMLLSWNNLHYYQELMDDLRSSIDQKRFDDQMQAIFETWAAGDIAPR